MPSNATAHDLNRPAASLEDVQWFFFDLDGTLADSIGGLDASIRVAFEAVGRARPDSDLRQWIGPGIRIILRNLEPSLSGEELDRMERAFRAHYDSEGILQTEMFGSVPALLRALKQAGRQLFIVTNKPKLATGILLQSKKLDGLFDAIVSRNSRDPHFASKGEMLAETAREYGADVARSVMVGDTAEDAEAAAHAGMRFVHAAYGYGQSPAPEHPRIEDAVALLDMCGLLTSATSHPEKGKQR